MKKKNILSFDEKSIFNDYCIREMKLDIDDYDHLVDDDTQSILQYKECFIKYKEDQNDLLRQDEIEMDLITNPRLMEMLTGLYLKKHSTMTGVEITSLFQSTAIRGTKGEAGITYTVNGKNETFWSDTFKNESVRMFNLICKLNKTDHMYNLENLDIVEDIR